MLMNNYSKKVKVLIVSIIAGIFFGCLLCGCGGRVPYSKKNDKIQPDKQVLYSVKDCSGYTTEFYEIPKRILPISNGMTAVLVDLVEPERILAISEDNLAKGSLIKSKAEKVRDKFSGWASTEMIIKLKPDLVIMPETSDVTKVQTLRDLGIRVVITIAPRNMEQIQERILFVAQAVYAENAGKRVIEKMNKKLNAIQDMKEMVKNNRKTILAFSSQGAYGRKGGLFDNLCDVAGIVNGAAEAGLKKMDHLSQEQIIQINPDYLLLPRMNGDDTFAIETLKNPVYQGIVAVQKKQYLILEEESYRYNVSQYAADIAYLIADAAYHPYLRRVPVFDY